MTSLLAIIHPYVIANLEGPNLKNKPRSSQKQGEKERSYETKLELCTGESCKRFVTLVAHGNQNQSTGSNQTAHQCGPQPYQMN